MKKGIRIAVLAAVGVLLVVVVFVVLDRCQGPAGNGTPGPTGSPTPELTEEQALARELIEPGGQVVYSDEECDQVFEAGEPWCVVIRSATPITRTEWEELLPQTEFYLVKTGSYANAYPREPGGSQNWLIVEHERERYTAETFDRLLAANGLSEITEDSREAVADALALVGLQDYLEDDVFLSPLEEGEWETGLGFPFTHALTAWTRIQGIEFRWLFVFREGRLRMAERQVDDVWVGDYVDVSTDILPLPALNVPETCYYWEA
jgi:hypothetical protein